jgi:peptide chain release factor 2
MRAEIQSVIDEIKQSTAAEEASLTSTRRAGASTELNKQAEDPNLWNDQQRAQRVMQGAPRSRTSSPQSAASRASSPTRS